MIRTTTTLLLVLLAIHSTALLSPAQVVGEQQSDLADRDQQDVEQEIDLELEEFDGSETLPESEDLPKLGGESEFSEIHTFQLKYVTGAWAGISLKDVFAEEIASGMCRVTSAENLVFVRSRDQKLLEKIKRVLGMLDVPEENPRQSEIEQIQKSLGPMVQAQVEEDPRYKEILLAIELHQEELSVLKDSGDANALRKQIAKLESLLQKRREEMLPQVLERVNSTIADETQSKNAIAFFSSVERDRYVQALPSDAQTQSLVESWRRASEEERTEIMGSLTEHVGVQFEWRQQRQQQQIEQLRNRLKRLESGIQRRIGSRDKIIENTVEQLLHNAPMSQIVPTRQAKSVNQPNSGKVVSSDVGAKRTAVHLTNQFSAQRAYSKEEIALLRTQKEHAEVMHRQGFRPRGELLQAQAAYQAAVSAVRQQAASLETELKLRVLDLKEAQSNLAASRGEEKRLRMLRENKSVTASAVGKAMAEGERAAIDVERAALQFEATKVKLEAVKSLKESFDEPVEAELGMDDSESED